MRAHEFIAEGKNDGHRPGHRGRMHPDQLSTMPRAHKFAGTTDRMYDLNRAMMAVASSDGKNFSHEPTEASWVGRSNLTIPYTEEEHNMLHHAYRHIGIDVDGVVHDHSSEPDSVYKTSPVTGFKGYPRRKSK